MADADSLPNGIEASTSSSSGWLASLSGIVL